MRKITLINSRGDELDLTTTELLMSELDGFGYERSDTYRVVGNRWLRTKSQLSQTAMSGTLIFNGSSPYQQYNDFIKFCTSTLIMEYTPDIDTFKRRCRLSKCGKSELDTTGTLQCKVEFMPFTPWYKSSVHVILPNESSGGWVWNGTGETENSIWPMTWSVDQAMQAVIESDSNMDSPCKLIIHGPMKNPSWEVYTAGEKVSTGKVTVTIAADCYLVVDNTTDPYSIKTYNDSGDMLEDVYQNSDFSTERFITLGYGSNVINVSVESDTDVEIRAEGEIYYESV